MNHMKSWCVALLVVVFVAGRSVGQDKKPDMKLPEAKVPDKKEAEKKLLRTQTVTGEITYIEANRQAFHIKLSYTYSELNQGQLNAMVQAQRDLAAARDVNAVRNAQVAYLQASARLYDVKTAEKTYTIEAGEDMKVRLPQPKGAFDDQGNIKKYTTKELAALRGPDRMFDGEFSDLQAKMIATVTIILPKPTAKPMKKDDIAIAVEPKIEASKVAVLRMPPVPPPQK